MDGGNTEHRPALTRPQMKHFGLSFLLQKVVSLFVAIVDSSIDAVDKVALSIQTKINPSSSSSSSHTTYEAQRKRRMPTSSRARRDKTGIAKTRTGRNNRQNTSASRRLPAIGRRHAIPAIAIAACSLTLFAFILEPHPSTPHESAISQRGIPIQLDLQKTSANTEPLIPEEETMERVSITVKQGDNLGLVFKRAGIGSTLVHKLAYESTHGSEFSNIQPGKQFDFLFNEQNKVTRVEYLISPLESYIAVRTEDGFNTQHRVTTPEALPTFAVGKIQSSFYLAGQEAGLSNGVIMELATIFGWDIDFVFDIREGDHFTVIYEERYLKGEKLEDGNVLAAEFVIRGKHYKAVRYKNQKGHTAYYTPSGDSMRKAFLRTPLDVFRVSSHFNLKRKHPILNTIRAHKGTDYAAPKGTPVRSSGNGRVIYAATQGSYGNVIKIQHGETYKTVYAHLNKFARKIRVGSRVSQGEIIGYVGTTGRSTAPHLHYEFYVNGSVRNPLTVNLPNGTPIHRSEMDQFRAMTRPALAILENTITRYANTDAASDSPGS